MAIADGQKANATNFNAAFADKNFQTLAAGTNFTIANNVSNQPVTGLIFNKLAYRSVRIEWQIYRKSTGGGAQLRVQRGCFFVWHDDTNWTLTQDISSATDAGVTFDIDATTGQITYTSDNQTGTYSPSTSVLSYQIVHTMRL
jgi:hypothetical protein